MRDGYKNALYFLHKYNFSFMMLLYLRFRVNRNRIEKMLR